MQLLGCVGVGHCLGGDRGVDLEQTQVVGAELVQSQLRQDDHAEDVVLEQHRREEQRFVEVVLGARDCLCAAIVRGVAARSGQDRGEPPSR